MLDREDHRDFEKKTEAPVLGQGQRAFDTHILLPASTPTGCYFQLLPLLRSYSHKVSAYNASQ